MSKKPKRTRITAPKTAAVKITIRQIVRHKGNSTWATYIVQGWKENGKWLRRYFKEEDEAKSFAALKQVEMENKGRAQRMILSSLTQEQHDSAISPRRSLLPRRRRGVLPETSPPARVHDPAP